MAQLVSLVDTSGFQGTLTGTTTLLATAGANQTFAGVAFAPTPEPTTFALAAFGLVGLGLFAKTSTPRGMRAAPTAALEANTGLAPMRQPCLFLSM